MPRSYRSVSIYLRFSNLAHTFEAVQTAEAPAPILTLIIEFAVVLLNVPDVVVVATETRLANPVTDAWWVSLRSHTILAEAPTVAKVAHISRVPESTAAVCGRLSIVQVIESVVVPVVPNLTAYIGTAVPAAVFLRYAFR